MYHQRTERPASDRAFAGGATWTLLRPSYHANNRRRFVMETEHRDLPLPPHWDEVYFGTFLPANRKPRYEPRAKWPRGSPCARSWALVRGSPATADAEHQLS